MSKYNLGIELGSTRIKAVAVDDFGKVVASSDYSWKSVFENGYWTYSLEEVDKGVQAVIDGLSIPLKEVKNMGISAMMHGYLAFDEDDKLLVPFRTWQNTNTTVAAEELSEFLEFNIPERWSVAHLYQAVLDKEEHISRLAHITTLAGYVHYKFTGERVLGIGDASGMFPVDSTTKQYNTRFVEIFDDLLEKNGCKFSVLDVLPEIKLAGERAGSYTIDGNTINFCPPEGDAGTGMIATNAIAPRTGNVSAGTSVFAMVVLEKALTSFYREIDVVTTPLGDEVAMVHANNCTLDINAWVDVFVELLEGYGVQNVDRGKLYSMLFNKALEAEPSAGGIVNYPYVTGEQITNVHTGLPALLRLPVSVFDLPNFMRAQLMSCLSALKIGFDILREEEDVELDKLFGHGGFFNTRVVGQKIMAAATNCEVAVAETSNEGGAWGMAVLAAFLDNKGELSDYLNDVVFSSVEMSSVLPTEEDLAGFDRYIKSFKELLPVERIHQELM